MKQSTPSVVNIDREKEILDNLTIDAEVVNNNTTIQQVSDIIRFFGLPAQSNRMFPSINDHESTENLHLVDKDQYERMVQFSAACIDHLIDVICPGPSKTTFIDDICKKVQQKYKKKK